MINHSTKLEKSEDEGDIEKIFEELKGMGVDVEKRGRRLEYYGNYVEFTIEPREAEYEIKGKLGGEGIKPVAYIQNTLKEKHGYVQERVDDIESLHLE